MRSGRTLSFWEPFEIRGPMALAWHVDWKRTPPMISIDEVTDGSMQVIHRVTSNPSKTGPESEVAGLVRPGGSPLDCGGRPWQCRRTVRTPYPTRRV